MKDFRQRAFVGLIGLVSAGLLSIGCSSSSDSSGTGGGNGTGTGGSHTGGSNGTGTGGSGTGTGGSGGGSTANACGPAGSGTTVPPAADLITDFSNASADGGTKIMFGTSTTVQGGVVSFQNPASTAGTVMLTGGALTYSATVSIPGTGGDAYPYSGFVVYINGPACVDASAYTGVSFSIKGDVGTCGLVFSFNDAEHGAPNPDDPRFTGPAGSYAPQKTLTVTPNATTVMVPFNDPTLANGSPLVSLVPVDGKNLTGVQWQLTNSNTATATCMGSITVDDVKFYK